MVFVIVNIFLNRIWYKLVEFFVKEIKIIFKVKKELKIILMVVLFFSGFFWVIKLIDNVVNKLKIEVLKI